MVVKARAAFVFGTFTVKGDGNSLKVLFWQKGENKKKKIGEIDIEQYNKCFSCCRICIASNDEHFLLIGCTDGSVISYGLSFSCIFPFIIMENAHPDAIIRIAFHIPASASSLSFMVAGVDNRVSVWEDHPDEKYYPRLVMRT